MCAVGSDQPAAVAGVVPEVRLAAAAEVQPAAAAAGGTPPSVQLLSMWPLVSVMPTALTLTASEQQQHHQVVVDITLSLPAPCTIYSYNADDLQPQAGNGTAGSSSQDHYITILATCCGVFLNTEIMQQQQQHQVHNALAEDVFDAATGSTGSGHAQSTSVVQVSASLMPILFCFVCCCG
jgi:hypothetical protein